MSNIQLENGRINIECLDGIADHLKALAIANKTIDSIKEHVAKTDPSDTGRFRRTNDALTAWRKMQRRITEKLSVLRQEEKQMNRMRSQFESEELLRLLRGEVSKEKLLDCRIMAQAIAEQRLQEAMSKAVSND